MKSFKKICTLILFFTLLNPAYSESKEKKRAKEVLKKQEKGVSDRSDETKEQAAPAETSEPDNIVGLYQEPPVQTSYQDKRFFLIADLGFSSTINLDNFWGDRAGGSFGLTAGLYATRRLSFDLFYKYAISGTTIILFGTGASASFLGADINYAVVRSERFRFELGARAAVAHFEGSDHIFLIPVNAYNLSTAGVGGTFAAVFDTNSPLFWGFKGQFLHIFGGDAEYTGILSGTSKVKVKSFYFADLAFELGVRF